MLAFPWCSASGLWTRRKLGVVHFVSQTFGRVASLTPGTIRCMLLLSFLGAVGICLVSTTVLEAPYPYNATGRWVPVFVMLFPTAIGLVVLGAAHVRQFMPMSRGAPLGSLLSLARINFIVSPVLSLLVVGSRGFITFIWIIAVGLEFPLRQEKEGYRGLGIALSLPWLLCLQCLAVSAMESGHNGNQ